jgi:hypothetical protein
MDSMPRREADEGVMPHHHPDTAAKDWSEPSDLSNILIPVWEDDIAQDICAPQVFKL